MDEDQRVPPPAPPPPPPPMCPPPPLPPLLPALGDLMDSLRKKKRVRSFYWKTIPEDQVKGRTNLWTLDRVQEKYQIDVQTIEELFGQTESTESTMTLSRGGKTRGSFREHKDEVCILDSKRGMNVGIFLKQFKRSCQTIVDDIRSGKSEVYGAEPLKELLKLLPETDEVTKLQAYRGDVSKLSMADTFVYLLIQLPSYSVRIKAMLLKEEFPAACEAMKRDIGILRSATEEVMSCEELHAVLHLVLQAGNLLNAGGYAGNAVGFKLSSLLSLADTKANKPGMNLLHFVALEAMKKDKTLLEFPLKLNHIEAASRISVETLDNELQSWMSRTSSVEENVESNTELLQQLEDFLQSASMSLGSLRDARRRLNNEGNAMIDFFCEDRDTSKLDDCFSIFHSFCCRFSDAVKDNKHREAKDLARRRLQDLEEQKRHSWSGVEQVGGIGKTRCSSDTDMTANKAGLLMELLSSQTGSPLPRFHSPFGRTVSTASTRRPRNSPSILQALKADHDLSMLLDMAEQEQQVSSRRGRREERTASSQRHQSPKQRTDIFPKSQKLEVPEASPAGIIPEVTVTAPVNTTSEDKPTSYMDQQPDLNNNGSEGLEQEPSTNSDQCLTTQPEPNMVYYRGHSAASNNNISVVLERHKLVPKLQAFDLLFRTPKPSHQGNSPPEDVQVSEEEIQKKDAQCQEKEEVKEEEKKEDTVAVWCVTGVCEDPQVKQTEGDNQDVFTTANHTPAMTHPTNEQVPSLPISSQPVPAPHCEDSPLLLASSRWAVPAGESSSDTVCQEESEDSEASPSVTVTEKAGSLPEDSVQTSAQNPLDVSKSVGSLDQTHKHVRTLTTSENQGMRRVVSINRTSKPAAPQERKKLLNPRTLLTSANLRQVERPSSAPSSRRSSLNNPVDPKDPEKKEAVTRNQSFQRKQSVRKVVERAKPEEKMCRSTLRALARARGAAGEGGSVSAPVTPVHKQTTLSSCPSFARDTASSSFRTTSLTTNSQQIVSPKSSSSSSSSGTTPTPTQTSSKRVPAYVRPSVREPLTSASLKRTEVSRASPLSSLLSLAASVRGVKRNDSGSLSDKSAHSRDFSPKPVWR